MYYVPLISNISGTDYIKLFYNNIFFLPPAGVATPLCAFTAVLEKLPVTGYDETNELRQLAIPRAINSWLASTL